MNSVKNSWPALLTLLAGILAAVEQRYGKLPSQAVFGSQRWVDHGEIIIDCGGVLGRKLQKATLSIRIYAKPIRGVINARQYSARLKFSIDLSHAMSAAILPGRTGVNCDFEIDVQDDLPARGRWCQSLAELESRIAGVDMKGFIKAMDDLMDKARRIEDSVPRPGE